MLIVFDFDGTLVDSWPKILKADGEVCRSEFRVNSKLTRDSVQGLRDFTLEALADLSLIPKEGWSVYKVRMKTELHRNRAKLVPGMEALVRGLHSRADLGVVTENFRRVVDETLQECGILKFFVSVRACEDQGLKAEKISSIREEVNASATVMVGDTVGDIVAGWEAGARCIGVTWGVHSRATFDFAGLEDIADTVEELQALLKIEPV